MIVDVGDPVGQGFVASLARPGGNVTGISNQATELAAKRLSLLKQAAPASRRIAVLFHPDDPVNEPQKLAIERHAPQLGVDINFFGVRSPADVSHAFAQLSSWRAEAVLWLIGQAATMQPRSIQLAAENRLPIMTVGRGSVRVGGFMSYYPDPHDVYRLAAHQIDRVLKGSSTREPAESSSRLNSSW